MVEVHVVSAFSKDNTGGNKAGLVFDRPDLNSIQKMAIAKELGYAETAFITKSNLADFCLEYFTPTEEVPLCGHA
ncbi:MAG: PhzF family phenazine biosynthesis protein, partial [Liquorilactobacillus satsumensis]